MEISLKDLQKIWEGFIGPFLYNMKYIYNYLLNLIDPKINVKNISNSNIVIRENGKEIYNNFGEDIDDNGYIKKSNLEYDYLDILNKKYPSFRNNLIKNKKGLDIYKSLPHVKPFKIY